MVENGDIMSEELDILKIVADNPNISQRKIAEQTGISLGQVNFLIKKCVKKGLIKLEGQTSKSIRYNLTPKGFAEKAALSLQYIKVSYSAVIALTDKIISIVESYGEECGNIIVYGPRDEMMGICKLALGDSAKYISDSSKLAGLMSGDICLYWDDEDTILNLREVEGNGCAWINILR